MTRILCACFCTVVLTADTGTAIRPSPSDYDAYQAIKNATIAARLLSPPETTRIFSSAVNKNFTVIEIAVYPENGMNFDVSTLDFALKTSADDRNYAVTPEQVAWHGKRTPSPYPATSGVHVITEAGIGIGSRTNPVTGRTDHGVTTYGGMEVDNRPGPSAQPSSGAADQTYVLEGKLRGLQLQEGQTTRPVSGYLYFASGKKQKAAPVVLEYSRSGERTLLNLPNR